MLIPKVTSVTALNASQVQVVFNSAIDKNTISVDDFTFAALDTFSGVSNTIVTVAPGYNVEGTLSTDGKTYTISTNDSTTVFRGRYDVKVAADTIRSTANIGVAKYSATLTFADTTAPSVAKVVATPVTDTVANVAITFNEQVSAGGTLTVNGVAYPTSVISGTGTDLNRVATFSNVAIDSDTAYPAVLVGATDLGGNVAGAANLTIIATADVTKPTVAITATNTTLNLKFSEKVSLTAGPAVLTINGTPLVATYVPVASDLTETMYTVDASAALGGSTFLNNAKVVLSAFEDLAGNVGKDTTAYVNLKTDTTAPVLVTKELLNNKLELKFDEKVASAAGVSASTLRLSYVNADGIIITPLTGSTWSAVIGKDLNNNGTIDVDTDEEKYVVVTFVDTANHNFTDTTNALKAGKYTFTWDKGLFADAAGNDVAAANFTLSPTNSSSATASNNYVAAISAMTPVNTKIVVTYDEAMSSNALTVANYKLAGAALPTGTTAAFLNDRYNVLITLPQGSITANGTRTLVAENVTAETGNTIDTDNQPLVTLDLVENVLPTLTSISVDSANSATATFSEVLATNAGATGVTVKVNGTTDAGATVTVAAGSNKATITTTTTLTQTSVVTLVFSATGAATDIQDVNGNVIADN